MQSKTSPEITNHCKWFLTDLIKKTKEELPVFGDYKEEKEKKKVVVAVAVAAAVVVVVVKTICQVQDPPKPDWLVMFSYIQEELLLLLWGHN